MYLLSTNRLMIYRNINIIMATDVFISSHSTYFIINCVINKKNLDIPARPASCYGNKKHFSDSYYIYFSQTPRLRRLMNLRSNNDYEKKNILCRSLFMCIKRSDYYYYYYATNYKATKQYNNCRRTYII